ncbi:MAG: hypothetical protein EKK55_19320 [Rhodocyclaceae bacterium]|nr:MAG: hypothetical protein EKK55_19320 [Rhodocyclaceae bacterium]
MDEIKLFWNGTCVKLLYVTAGENRTSALRRAAAEAVTDLRYGIIRHFAEHNEVAFDVQVNGKDCGEISVSASIRLSMEDAAA